MFLLIFSTLCLKESAVEIIAVGIGPDINDNELHEIAEPSDSDHVVRVNTYESLTSKLEQIVTGMCEDTNPGECICRIEPLITIAVDTRGFQCDVSSKTHRLNSSLIYARKLTKDTTILKKAAVFQIPLLKKIMVDIGILEICIRFGFRLSDSNRIGFSDFQNGSRILLPFASPSCDGATA